MQSHDDCHSATSVYVLKRVFATVRSTYSMRPQLVQTAQTDNVDIGVFALIASGEGYDQ